MLTRWLSAQEEEAAAEDRIISAILLPLRLSTSLGLRLGMLEPEERRIIHAHLREATKSWLALPLPPVPAIVRGGCVPKTLRLVLVERSVADIQAGDSETAAQTIVDAAAVLSEVGVASLVRPPYSGRLSHELARHGVVIGSDGEGPARLLAPRRKVHPTGFDWTEDGTRSAFPSVEFSLIDGGRSGVVQVKTSRPEGLPKLEDLPLWISLAIL